MLSTPGPMELIIILGIVILIFGGSRMAGLGKSLGTSIREFKTAIKEDDAVEKSSTEEKKEEAE